jgi:hypothetical protein
MILLLFFFLIMEEKNEYAEWWSEWRIEKIQFKDRTLFNRIEESDRQSSGRNIIFSQIR